MAMSAVLNWFGRAAKHTPGEQPRPFVIEPPRTPLKDPPPAVARPPLPWSPDRLSVTDTLWGEGYQFPGGEAETLRLAKPLGLSAASSLLMLGAGSGGPACAVATKLGAWVSGFEADPSLAAAATERVAQRNLTKRVQFETCDPAQLIFRKHFYHHCLALEALHGTLPERALSAISDAIMPGGQLMMVDLVADTPLDPANRIVSGWTRLARLDPASLPKEASITRILGRLGFDVRVAEDVTQRQVRHALAGWRTVVHEMEYKRPSRREAMRYIQEAELWMLRLRLFQTGWLRLVRWHAIGAGG